MTSVSAGHIILTPTQPVGSGRPQLGSNPGPPQQESRALPTELPRPPTKCKQNRCVSLMLRLYIQWRERVRERERHRQRQRERERGEIEIE